MKDEATNWRAELCLHVERPCSRYDLQPATTWRSDSGRRQKVQSDELKSFHKEEIVVSSESVIQISDRNVENIFW